MIAVMVGNGMDGDKSGMVLGKVYHFTVAPLSTRRLTAAVSPNSLTTVSNFTSMSTPTLANSSIAASTKFGGGGESGRGLLSWLSFYWTKESGS